LLDFSRLTEFEWDAGNDTKIWKKHKVTKGECEEVFFNQPLVVLFDADHSDVEDRYYALGKTDMRRHLFVVFTPRGSRIRVISARDMTPRERRIYHGS
jgi:uncharacterized DUF497 family protein